MDFLDFRNLTQTSFETDLCIVGTGPAGLAIARELSRVACRVLMIESGDLRQTAPIAGLNEFENIGAPRQRDHALVRWRGFGGTSEVWNGRCAPLEPLDFEERSWVPDSGWPFDREQLASYFARAAENLGLYSTEYDAELDARLPEPMPQVRDADVTQVLRSVCWQFSVDDSDPSTATRCARSFRRLAPSNTRVLLNATATRIIAHVQSSGVDGVEIKSLNGKSAHVWTKVLVLCAGGIETPRLLLASDPLGNRHDLVGRYFMDHPRCVIGDFDRAAAARVRMPFNLQRLDAGGQARIFLRGLALSPETQRQEQLLNCAGWLDGLHSGSDPWSAIKRLARGQSRRWLHDIHSVVTQPRLVARQLRRRVLDGHPVIHKLDGISIVCDVEQTPDRASRITLSDQTDALGMRRARIDWRIGELERRTVQRYAQLAAHTFQRMGLPAPELRQRIVSGEFYSSDFSDVAHPSGGTRMASDPRSGVVDEHCQVHGVDRLYIVGSSIFPTNGHANPTLTIVALAIRLADRMKARHFERPSKVLLRQPELALS